MKGRNVVDFIENSQHTTLTVQLSRFQWDSPDNEAHVLSPASPMVGTIDVPTSALYL